MLTEGTHIMKITNIEAIPVRIPFTHGGPLGDFITGKDWTELGHLLVKIDTDSGITGYGESFGFDAIQTTKTAIDSLISPMIIGRDASQIEVLMNDLALKTHIFGRYGITTFALSGIDIALWDIAGKAAGLPLNKLLGGPYKADVPAYASLLKYEDPAVCARLTEEALGHGYRFIKLHENTVEPVAAARSAGGNDLPIMLDVNCSWSPQQASKMAEALLPYDLHWLEEPLWPPENFEALADLRSESGIPIAAGENACTAWQFDQMFRCGAVDYAQASVTKVGGLTEMRKISALAEVANIRIQPHSPYFGPGFLATLHFIASSRGIESIERFYVELEADMYGNALTPVDGVIHVPDGPGLGIDPDPEFIKRYRSDIA